MNIEIITATDYPIDVISYAAGTCYGKDDYPMKRVRSCYGAGHMSVFEHAGATFKVWGISRACSHQLVRHRLASFCQESQRYCKIDTESDDWYVMPPWFDGDSDEERVPSNKGVFEYVMEQCAIDYQEALGRGCKPEDARYLLPEACKTNITVTMNCRELFHFLDMRQDKSAQWEIRELADLLEAKLRSCSEQWCELMTLRGGGGC